MNKFVTAVQTPMTTTTNGMTAFPVDNSSVTDLFFNAGAARNNPNIVQQFVDSFRKNPLLTLKLGFWMRDVRGGAGERKVFRDVLQILEMQQPEVLLKNLHLVPFYGRWDDLQVLSTPVVKQAVYELYKHALLTEANGLAAKWCKRKGPFAVGLTKYLGMTPKQYRKLIVGLSNTVEQKLCAQEFGNIDYEHVPSVAASRYQATFTRHDPQGYGAYKEALASGDAKINASVVFPHDVIRGGKNGDWAVAEAQWKALPNYTNSTRILPISDVSGSMTCRASGSVTCMDVSIALGLYLAEKNTGPFKDLVCTFDNTPRLIQFSGSLEKRVQELANAPWGGSTNFEATFDLILQKAKRHNVPTEDMPEVLVCLSDMQFNQASRGDFTAVEMAKQKYEDAGYKCPLLVFWNLNGEYDNKPSANNENGVVMVSGFSPSIMKAVLACDFDKITPEAMMLSVLNSERYAGVTL